MTALPEGRAEAAGIGRVSDLARTLGAGAWNGAGAEKSALAPLSMAPGAEPGKALVFPGFTKAGGLA